MDSGFFGRGFCGGRGWGPETRPDCEVDWRGIGGGFAVGSLESGVERREKSHGEAQKRPAI